MIRRIVPAVAVLSLLVVLSAPSPAPAEQQKQAQPGQRGHKLHKKIEVEVKLNYLLFLPKDYGKEQGRKWPVIMFLHGAGERGDDLEKVKIHGPPKIVEGRPDFPFIVVSPQCPADKWWDPQELVALLDEVLANYDADPDRVYLTGLSLGGYGTWSTAIAYPDRFAAIAPVCGGGNPRQVRRIKDMPVWVFHGEEDEAVPIARSEEMVNALQQAGAAAVKFTRYPGVGHDSWVPAYNDQALYDWFLRHRRGAQPTRESPRQPAQAKQ